MTQEQLDAARQRLYALMIQHIGPDKKVGMGELYEAVIGKSYSNRINDTRLLRKLVTEMRSDGMPVLSDGAGYWLSASSSELNQYCERSKKRALSMLARCSRMKKVSLPDYLGQMRLELEAADEKASA
jgi:hypothetical protein